jgi:hypothetical protein
MNLDEKRWNGKVKNRLDSRINPKKLVNLGYNGLNRSLINAS